MSVAKEADRRPLSELFALGPPVVERMGLETKPGAAVVSSYVLTRSAETAWQTINRHLDEPGGRVFWISGPSGSGKTHFLSYVLALHNRAGSAGTERGRRVAFGLEVAGRVRGPEIEAYLLEALAEQLSPDDRRGAAMWREVRGAAAIRIALENARRLGITALTAAIDFGTADSGEVDAYFATLHGAAADFKNISFKVIAASRSNVPDCAVELGVAPADDDEAALVAVNRARLLNDGARDAAAEFYREIDPGGFAPLGIFPFHPAAIRALKTLASPPGTVAAQAVLAREALITASYPHPGSLGRLIYPADLAESPGFARRLEDRLGQTGFAALRMAWDTLKGLQGNELELAREMIGTLVLEYATGRSSIPAPELVGLLPMLAGYEAGEAWTAPVITELLRKVASRSQGVICFEAQTASFDPAAAGAPELAAFNAALPLLRCFDPELTPVHDRAAMEASRARVASAMASAVEAANRTADTLCSSLARENLALSAQQRRVIDDYLHLAGAGPSALVDAAQDPSRRQLAVKTIHDYSALAQAAAMVPRMRAMREYLDATGLRIGYEENPQRDRRVVALETECQLLRAEMGSRILIAPPRNLDSLEARFQKFKWTYVQQYRSAHDEWKAEMARLGRLAEDLRSYLDALRRLNSIAVLGPAEGSELAALAAETSRRIARCDFDGALAPELTPRCPGCGFVLGADSPRVELDDLLDRARRALEKKFAALSQSAIARIIREHDRNHRLEGFLKITQAAQTDALVRLLDDKLARYLARLLDENLGSAGAKLRGVVQPLDEARFKTRRSRAGRSAIPSGTGWKRSPHGKDGE